MSILKLLFALNPKNLKVVRASEMTSKMASEIDSFLGKMGAVTHIGKYELTPSQMKYWKAQRDELTKFQNKYNEIVGKNKAAKEGIESLKNKPSAEIIEFPIKPEELLAHGGRVGLMTGGFLKLKQLYDLAKKLGIKIGEAPKTNIPKVRARVKAEQERFGEAVEDWKLPVKDVTKKPYKFTGEETLDDLYKLEEKGIISRSDHNVFDERYLDYVDAQVAKMYNLTEQQINKMPIGRLNVLRAHANPNWAEANYGENYLSKLHRARDDEMKNISETGMFDDLFDRMYSEYEYSKFKDKGGKPHAKGGLITMFMRK